MARGLSGVEKDFLKDDEVQVAMVHSSVREAFLDWLRDRGMTLFVVPHEGNNGKLTTENPADDFQTYATQPVADSEQVGK